jgi:hypothetical protein
MSTTIHSQESTAAERYVRATREVDRAFRLVRGKAGSETMRAAHATSIRRLELALDKLAVAQELFDAIVTNPKLSGH